MKRAINIFAVLLSCSSGWAATSEPVKQPVLGLTLYIIRSEPIVPRDKFFPLLEEHLEYQYKIEDEGILFAAGPLVAEGASGPRGTGVIVVRAASFDQARTIADADPFHKNKLKQYTLHRWIVNEGGINLNIKFSDSSVLIE